MVDTSPGNTKVKGQILSDAGLIFVAAFLRSSTVGLVGVLLAIHLAVAGVSPAAIGGVMGAGLAGAAGATALVSVRADVIGRRRMLMALAVLSALGYAAIAATDRVTVLLPLAFLGMLNGMGRDRGAASALEQAILPETTTAERRTWVLAWYNMVLDAGHAVGSLAAVTPVLLVSALGADPARAHRLTFLICAFAVAATIAPYARLSQRIEVPKTGYDPVSPARQVRLKPDTTEEARTPRRRWRPPLGGPDLHTRRTVFKLAALFGLDSIGGGFLSSALIAYWFFARYGMSETELAMLFFAARILNTGSHALAAWMARRIGLLNTMVFTHLPSSLFLMAAPAAPTAGLAAALFLCREALVEMDVPTRQSYVMAIVRPEERSFASGVTNVTRTLAWAVGPSVAGAVMQHVMAGPLFIGGTLKIGYDLLLYRSFRRIKPPEE